MTYIKKVAVCAALIGLLAACASPARMNAMIPERTEATLISESSPLAKALEIGAVSGGEETNPMWTSEVGNPEFKEALKNALANHAMLSEGAGRYKLTATMTSVDQPIFGASFTVTASVRYHLIEVSSGTTVFDQTITEPYTANFSDAFLAVERLRLANEGAMRVNIGTFLKALVSHSKSLTKAVLNDGIYLAAIGGRFAR